MCVCLCHFYVAQTDAGPAHGDQLVEMSAELNDSQRIGSSAMSPRRETSSRSASHDNLRALSAHTTPNKYKGNSDSQIVKTVHAPKVQLVRDNFRQVHALPLVVVSLAVAGSRLERSSVLLRV